MGPGAQSGDTTVEAAAVQRSVFAEMTGPQRLMCAMEMAEEVKQITLAGIAQRNPEMTDEAVHTEWLRILHGDDLAQRLR